MLATECEDTLAGKLKSKRPTGPAAAAFPGSTTTTTAGRIFLWLATARPASSITTIMMARSQMSLLWRGRGGKKEGRGQGPGGVPLGAIDAAADTGAF